MRYEPQGLERYARHDDASSIRVQSHVHVPGWIGAYIWCLRKYDFESAHLIRALNDERYAARTTDAYTIFEEAA